MCKIALLALLLLSLFLPPKVFAVSISIDSYPNEVTESEFTVGFTIAGAKKARNYIRVLVYKEGTHSYHGLTWNGLSWYEGSSGKEYFAIDIVENETKGIVKGKVPVGFPGGEYLLSLKRYTASGNSSDDSVSPQKITVKLAIPVSTQTPVSQVATSTPVVTVLPENTQTPVVIVQTNEPIVLAAKSEPETESFSPETNAPIATQPETAVPTQTPWKRAERDSSVPIVAVVCMIPAIGLILYGGYLFWKIGKDWYTKSSS